MSDLESFLLAKAATVYRLGSISKRITAVAAMQLVEQCKPRGFRRDVRLLWIRVGTRG